MYHSYSTEELIVIRIEQMHQTESIHPSTAAMDINNETFAFTTKQKEDSIREDGTKLDFYNGLTHSTSIDAI